MGVFSTVEHIFNETAMYARAQASSRLAKTNRASNGPRVRAKARVKKTRENPKDNPKEPKVRTKVPEAYTRAKHRKLVSQVFKTLNQRQARKHRNLHRHVPLTLSGTMVLIRYAWNDGWALHEWYDDWSSVGWHEGWETNV